MVNLNIFHHREAPPSTSGVIEKRRPLVTCNCIRNLVSADTDSVRFVFQYFSEEEHHNFLRCKLCLAIEDTMMLRKNQ